MRGAVTGPASRVKHPRACREPAAKLVQRQMGVIPPVPAVGRDPFASVCDFILHFLSLPRFSTTEPTDRRGAATRRATRKFPTRRAERLFTAERPISPRQAY